MKKIITFLSILAFTNAVVYAQVKIGNNVTNIKSASLLELESTNKGIVFPRVSLTALNSPAPLASDILTGTLVYNTNTALPTGTGVYVWSDSSWVSFTRAGQQAISIPNPDSTVTLTGTYAASGASKGVFISGNYAYVATGTAGLRIINISNPASPILAGTCITGGSAEGVYVRDNYAYIADYTRGLVIINVTNPASPTVTGTYHISDFTPSAYSVFVKGDYAYMADYYYGLVIINISNPANPTFISNRPFQMFAQGVYVSGNFAYLTVNNRHGLLIIDVTNPGNPTVTGTYTTGTGDGCHAVQVRGNFAYLANDTAGLKIINISNPASPTLAGTYNTSGAAYSVSLNGNYAYVADGTGGLQIIDIGNPVNPVLATTYNTGGSAQGVYIKDKYAYVANNTGLQVIKIPGVKNIVYVSNDTAQLGALAQPSGKGLVMADNSGTLSKATFTNGLLSADANGAITATTDYVSLLGNQTINGGKTFSANLIANGNVGIGTNAPYSQLSNTSGNTIASNGSGGNPGSFSWSARQDGYVGQFYNNDSAGDYKNGLMVKVASATSTAFDVSRGATQNASGNSLLTVKSNGGVGIGTNAPYSQLSNTSINTAGSDGSGGNAGSFSWAATQQGYVGQFYNADAGLVNRNGLAVKVASSNSTALDVSQGTSQNIPGNSLLIVKSGGNVGIGTSQPADKLNIIPAASGGLTIGSTVTGKTQLHAGISADAGGYSFLQSIKSEGTAYGDIIINKDGGKVGIGTNIPDQLLTVNGNASKPGGGSWATFSDARLKKNVQDYNKGLKEILAIQPVSFQYNQLSGYADLTKTYVGIVAQEMEKILPSTISSINSDSNVKSKLQYDGSELTYTLINAIKEQQAEIEALKQKLANEQQLAKRIEQLEAIVRKQ